MRLTDFGRCGSRILDGVAHGFWTASSRILDDFIAGILDGLVGIGLWLSCLGCCVCEFWMECLCWAFVLGVGMLVLDWVGCVADLGGWLQWAWLPGPLRIASMAGGAGAR